MLARDLEIRVPDVGVKAIELRHFVDMGINVVVDAVAPKQTLVVSDTVSEPAPGEVALVAADRRVVSPGTIEARAVGAPLREARLRNPVQASVIRIDDGLAQALEESDLGALPERLTYA